MSNGTKELEGLLAGLHGGEILDVATGVGNFLHFIKEFKSYSHITAIDCDPAAERAIEGFKPELRVSFRLMEAEHLDFPEAQFDTVCLSNSLHHLREPDAVLAEMQRVLKPGGALIINEMYCDGQSPAQLSHVLMHHWWAKIDGLFGIVHSETFTRAELLALIERLPLHSLEVIDYAWPMNEAQQREAAENILKISDRYQHRLHGRRDAEGLLAEGKRLREYVMEHGFQWASAVFALGWKWDRT